MVQYAEIAYILSALLCVLKDAPGSAKVEGADKDIRIRRLFDLLSFSVVVI